MIGGFRHRGLKRFYESGETRRLPSEDIGRIRRIISRLDASATPQDMEAPGFHLHRLKGELRGFWSVTVRANWRVIFRFENGEAQDVDLIDYH